MSASQVSALSDMAQSVVSSHDCDLEGVSIRRAGNRRLVRIVVDHRAGELTLDRVADISRDIADRLEDSALLGESSYVLEVTSPGVDRPLTLTRHWVRAVGRLVRITRSGSDPIVGRLTSADERSVVLDVDGTRIPLARTDVTRATVQVEFSRDEEADEPDTAEPGRGRVADPPGAGDGVRQPPREEE